MLEHLLDLYQFYGEELGVRFARKHLSWYCMHLEDTTTFKKRVVRVNKASKQIELVEEFFQKPV